MTALDGIDTGLVNRQRHIHLVKPLEELGAALQNLVHKSLVDASALAGMTIPVGHELLHGVGLPSALVLDTHSLLDKGIATHVNDAAADSGVTTGNAVFLDNEDPGTALGSLESGHQTGTGTYDDDIDLLLEGIGGDCIACCQGGSGESAGASASHRGDGHGVSASDRSHCVLLSRSKLNRYRGQTPFWPRLNDKGAHTALMARYSQVDVLIMDG